MTTRNNDPIIMAPYHISYDFSVVVIYILIISGFLSKECSVSHVSPDSDGLFLLLGSVGIPSSERCA